MRLTQIDTAKFIAIYLVILSHCSMNSVVGEFLFSFHVQLFFICFGFVYKRKSQSFCEIMGGVIKRLLIPYILLALVLGSPLSIEYLVKVLYGGHICGVNGVDHLWFLPCFFLSAVLFTLLYNWLNCKHWTLFFLSVVICALISSYFDYDSETALPIGNKVVHLTGYAPDTERDLIIGFPYSFNAALSGVVLMYIGLILRKINNKYNVLQNKRISIVVGAISLIIGYFSYYVNQSLINNDFPFHLITPSYAIYGNYMLFLVTSTLLTISTISIASLLDNKYLAEYGKETMTIYAFHPFTLGVIGSWGFPSIFGLVPSFLALCITCLIIPLIKKIDPYLIGYFSKR